MIECPFCHESSFTIDIDGVAVGMDHRGIPECDPVSQDVLEASVAHCLNCGRELHPLATDSEVVTFQESVPFEDHQLGQ
jgi:hypothetical protein